MEYSTYTAKISQENYGVINACLEGDVLLSHQKSIVMEFFIPESDMTYHHILKFKFSKIPNEAEQVLSRVIESLGTEQVDADPVEIKSNSVKALFDSVSKHSSFVLVVPIPPC
ncbi:hypothetical protein H4219_003669 [Mycoemilia scoparia]|uniref:Uncharacterized protein n=1 Tax=Mycoemilia scoparia TaxID=417184 RepID=A0A9W8DMJ1_9FUNG|nr:hypothetical protein H4219_003669 [Mycoemilia scoparia]